MSMPFGALCDDFYTSTRLNLKLGLTLDRETVLHFFEAIRREFPGLTKMRRCEEGGISLEEQSDTEDPRRWIRVEESALRFGCHNPEDEADTRKLGRRVLELAPYHFTLSDLDYDHLELVYGFDLEYRGNHDQLIAETLWADHPFHQMAGDAQVAHAIDCQPFIGVSLTEECDLQAYVECKSRTSTYEARSMTYDTQPLSVYLTMRQYCGVAESQTLQKMFDRLCDLADEWAVQRVVPIWVNPLAHAISSRPQ